MMEWQTLCAQLFKAGHSVVADGHYLHGQGWLDTHAITVIGTTAHAEIGVEIALAQAQAVLATVRDFPHRPILLLVDTVGQRLRHRDEMLGIHAYMAHLGKCLELARQSGHKIIALVYDQALSGGFITSGMQADACYALADASIRVMGLPAMARISKIAEEKLQVLAQSHPVFAPGPQNFVAMGGIAGIWQGDLADCMRQALRTANSRDQRSRLGAQRGGRQHAQAVRLALAEQLTHG